ncbi:MAG: hypothetical protein Q4G04_03530 [bacterium]|nr:hypothetical protein [bacterium]
MENINDYVLEIYTEKQKFDDNYNKIMFDFINGAYELVDLSNDLYQVEHTINLNKISLKDYILNSKLCNMLKENNITDYSISELNMYMNKCEEQNLMDITPYKLALNLYEKLERLENLVEEKINYEIGKIEPLINDIKNIKIINKQNIEELYNNLINELKNSYLNKNQIDDKLYNYLIQILNDIVNYYLYGNKDIPLND